MPKVSDLLQTLMTENHLTAYALSRRTKVHQTTIANILAGKEPQDATISRLAAWFELDPEAFKRGEAKKNKPAGFETNELKKDTIIQEIKSGAFTKEQLDEILFAIVDAIKEIG